MRTHTLTDGTEVVVRPIVPDDGPGLREGLQRLSERTRWLRFHAPISDFTDDQLRHLVEVDHAGQEAIVAETLVDGRMRPIAVGRYAASGEDGPVELALVVEDAWQGRGVGRIVLRALFTAARESGITELTAEVLAENRAILGLLEAEATELHVERDGSMLHLTIDIADPSSAS